MINSIFLDYDFHKFLNADYSNYSISGLENNKKELTDIHSMYSDTGKMPETYTQENTTIQQLWWSKEDINFDELENKTGINIKTVSSICQKPGIFITMHKDMFYAIKSKEDTTNKHLVRANIYLENWKPGHIFQYEKNNDWSISTHWKAGEGFIFDENHIHLSANAGLSNKYTLQISGYLN